MKEAIVRCLIDCGIPEVSNGKFVYNSTLVNSSAALECNEGHMPLDIVEAHCLPTGSWTSNEPLCILIECDPKPHVPNGKGRLIHGVSFYGSRLQIICNRGYAAKEISCDSKILKQPFNGKWISMDETNRTKVLKCNQGYLIDGFPAVSLCQLNGSWSSTSATCKKISCDPKKLKRPFNGKWISINGTNHTKKLACRQGYIIEGYPVISSCQSNGSWSFTSATCKRRSRNETWINGLSPTTKLGIAIAVGAGTALAMCVLMIKKKWRAVLRVCPGMRRPPPLPPPLSLQQMGQVPPPC